MKQDSTISNIFADIKNEIAEKFNVDISIAEINEIASSQFSASVMAFNKGIDVRLPHFGRFERRYKHEAKEYRKYLKEMKEELSEEEYKELELKVKLQRLEDNKQRHAKNRKTVTLEEFINAPRSSNVPNAYAKIDKGEKLDIRDFFIIGRGELIDRLQGS